MSTVGGYHEYRGGYLEYRGVFSTVGISSVPWGCSVLWGDIMSTVGGIQYHGGYHPLKFEYRGGYHEYRGGCSVPWGTQITKDFSPHSTEHPPRYS